MIFIKITPKVIRRVMMRVGRPRTHRNDVGSEDEHQNLEEGNSNNPEEDERNRLSNNLV